MAGSGRQASGGARFATRGVAFPDPGLAYLNGDTWSCEPVAIPDQLCLKCHLTDDSRNPADGLLYDAAARHNIHAITCDTCHQPTGVSTHYTVVYGSSVNLTISGHRITNAGIPASAATGVVQLWVRHSVNQLYSLAGVTGSASSALGTPFVLRPSKPLTTNSLVYVTQGNDADGFPGLGRGTEATVSVKALVILRTSGNSVQPRGVVNLSASVAPAKAGQKVYVQLSHNGRTWSTVNIVKLSSSSTATLSWRAPATSGRLFLRLRFLGDKANVGNVSATHTITVN
ncbi:MAG: hypothetical protein ACLQUT_02240 [Thermoleophilia bacterium]